MGTWEKNVPSEYVKRIQIMQRTRKPLIYKLPNGRWFAATLAFAFDNENQWNTDAKIAVLFMNTYGRWPR